MADDQTFHDDIEGYAGRLSYRAGETVTLHVSTHRPRFDVVVERWGATRVSLWEATDVPGRFVEPPPDADSAGCRWPTTIEIPVGDDWQPGFHLVTLTAHGAPAGRDVAHACFVVRRRPDDRAQARALLVLDTNTWHAYNTWGGRSLYTGGTTVSHARPFGRGMLWRPEVERDDRKARPVRWGEEPDVDGSIFQRYRTEHAYPAAIGSAGWFTHARRFVEWAEGSGHRFDYAVSSDLDRDVNGDPDALAGYDLVLSVGHDEYWSAGQRRAVEDHVRRGGNFASFSGNTMFWQVRLEAAVAGWLGRDRRWNRHGVSQVRRPPRRSGRCGRRPDRDDRHVGRPARGATGVGTARSRLGLRALPPLRQGDPARRRRLRRVPRRPLDAGGHRPRLRRCPRVADGVVGYETLGCPLTFDDLQLPVARAHPGLPADIEIVAFTPSSNLVVGEYPASISALSDQGDAEFIATRLYGDAGDTNLARVRHGNAVMLTCRPFGPDGGEVVTVGSTDWVFGLASDPAVMQVTANVLGHLAT